MLANLHNKYEQTNRLPYVNHKPLRRIHIWTMLTGKWVQLFVELKGVHGLQTYSWTEFVVECVRMFFK